MQNLGISCLEIWILLKQMTTSDYLSILAQLPVNKKGSKIAPHKAILLLSICDLIEQGVIRSPFIPLDDNLNRAFNSRWKKHVPLTSPFSRRLCYPFYHMSSSDFWHLEKSPSYTENKEYSSLTSLKRSFTGATINRDFFELLKDTATRNQIRKILISTYLESDNSSSSNTTIMSVLPLLALICSVA